MMAYDAVAAWIVKGLGDPPQWPRNAMEWVYFQSRFFPKEFLSLVSRLEEKGYNLEYAARLMRYPSTITHWLYFPESNFGCSEEYWARDLSSQEGVDFIEKTIDLLYILRGSDVFCEGLRNTLLSHEDITNIMYQHEFIGVENKPEISKIVSLLNMVLWHYTILIQGGSRVYSQELHGPYPLNDSEILFIKEYSALKPEGIWEFTSALDYEEITFYEIYKDIEINIDMFGHYFISEPSYKSLSKVAILVNKENISMQNIKPLYEKSSQILEAGNSIVANFNRTEWTKKWIELGYLALKPFRDILNESWYPPAEILSMAESAEEAKLADISSDYHLNFVKNTLMSCSKEDAIEKIRDMHLKAIYHE
ncbi:MAG: hypothetical protein ACMUIU_09710 [bacterium]